MACATVAAGPLPDRERHRGLARATHRAAFTAWREAINQVQLALVPLGLAGQLPAQFLPANIGDRLGQVTVLEHAAHVEVLERNGVVFADHTRGEFMQVVASAVCHAGVQSSDDPALAMPTAAAPGLTRQSALGALELALASLQVSRVGAS